MEEASFAGLIAMSPGNTTEKFFNAAIEVDVPNNEDP